MGLVLILMLLPIVLLLGVTLWNVMSWPKVGPSINPVKEETVSILIPARNEESNLTECLERALAQGAVVNEVLVYDDHSTDKTAQIVADHNRVDARVQLISPKPLPVGWCGKPFACVQLAALAKGHWLLFLDADARLQEGSVSRAVAEVESRNITLLSCWPALELCGFWEQVLMPLLNFVVFTLYPAPLALKRSDASLGLAHGSFILICADAYFRTGGHKLVRGEIFEDTRLAQRWRECGERGLCLDGQNILQVRMYSSLGDIWHGFQKNFFPAFRQTRSFVAFFILHFIFIFLPFVLAPIAVYSTWAQPFALVATVVVVMRLAFALRFGHPLWSIALHPLAEAILIAVGLASWRSCRFGRGVEWKGRRYHPSVRASQT